MPEPEASPPGSGARWGGMVDGLLLVLLFQVLAWNLAAFGRAHPVPAGPDELGHVHRSFELASRLNPWAPDGLQAIPQDPSRPPLVYLASNLFYPALGFSVEAARTSTLLFLALLIGTTYGLGRLAWNRTTGLLAALLAATCPGILRAALSYSPTLGTVAMTGAALYTLLLARRSGTPGNLALASAFVAGAYLTKPTFALFHAAMAVPLLWGACRVGLEKGAHRAAVMGMALLSPAPAVAWFLWRSETASVLLPALSLLLAGGAVGLGAFLSSREGRPGAFWSQARTLVLPSVGGMLVAAPYYLSHLQWLHRHLYRLGVEEVHLYPYMLESTLPPLIRLPVTMGEEYFVSLACGYLFLAGAALLALSGSRRRANGFLVLYCLLSLGLFTLFPVQDPRWPLPVLPAAAVVAASVVGARWGRAGGAQRSAGSAGRAPLGCRARRARMDLARRGLAGVLAVYLALYPFSWVLQDRRPDLWVHLERSLGAGWILPAQNLSRP